MPLLTTIRRAAAGVILTTAVACHEPRVSTATNDQRRLGALSFAFRRIPAGQLVTGVGPRTLNPKRRFVVHEFWLATTPVTNLDYEKFDPEHRRLRPEFSALDTSPVTGITWQEAVRYCDWLSSTYRVKARLPTSIEWEHACLGGGKGPYPFGKTTPIWDNYARRYANFLNTRAVAVAQYAANGYGLFDMAGNVAEMCSDQYVFDDRDVRLFPGDADYERSAALPKNRLKAVKNCAANVSTLFGCECASMSVTPPEFRNPTQSFRVAITSLTDR